jgi:plasmid maintenance system killer protein
MILAMRDTASVIGGMRNDLFRLHAVKSLAQGRWSVRVNGNWRITFEFHDSHAYVLDYEDYH